MTDPQRRSLEKAALIALSAILAIPLAVYAYLGSFARYLADDYCVAAYVQQHGLIDSLLHSYVSWSGRYAASLLISGGVGAGTAFVAILPLLLIGGMLSSAFLLFRTLIRLLNLRYAGWIALILTELCLATTFDAALQEFATIGQAFYWPSGSLSYIPLLIAAPLCVVMMLTLARREWNGVERIAYPILGVLTCFVLAGFNETGAAALVGLLIGGLGLVWLTGRDRRLIAMLAGALIGVIGGLIVMAAAPGTSARQETFSEPLPLAQVVIQAPLFSLGLLGLWARAAPFGIALVLILPALLMRLFASDATRRTRRLQRILWLLPLALYSMLVCALAPGLYVTHIPPPSRALIDPTYILIIGATLISLIAGIPSERERHSGWVTGALGVIGVVALVGSLIPLARQVPQQIADQQAYAAAWDAQEATILASREAGDLDVEVPALPNDWLLDTLHPQAEWWINSCAAEYYGVEGISTP